MSAKEERRENLEATCSDMASKLLYCPAIPPTVGVQFLPGFKNKEPS